MLGWGQYNAEKRPLGSRSVLRERCSVGERPSSSMAGIWQLSLIFRFVCFFKFPDRKVKNLENENETHNPVTNKNIIYNTCSNIYFIFLYMHRDSDSVYIREM